MLQGTRHVHLFTDGAVKGNGKPDAIAGWGWALYDKTGDILLAQDCGQLTPELGYVQSNNTGELMGVIEGLEDLPEGTRVAVYSDSAYVVNAFLNKWVYNWERSNWFKSDGEPVKNQHLWERLLKLVDNRDVLFVKVKGHSGIEQNEYVDKLAKSGVLGEKADWALDPDAYDAYVSECNQMPEEVAVADFGEADDVGGW